MYEGGRINLFLNLRHRLRCGGGSARGRTSDYRIRRRHCHGSDKGGLKLHRRTKKGGREFSKGIQINYGKKAPPHWAAASNFGYWVFGRRGGGTLVLAKISQPRACMPPRTPLPRWVSLVLVVHKAAWQSTGQGVRGSRAASSIRPHHTYFFSTLIHCISICSSH